MLKNQKLFLSCIFILSFQACGILNLWKHRDYEIKKSYYDDGSLEYKSSYFNDKLDGASYYHSIDGSLLTYAEYENGSLHGMSKIFYQTGEIQYSCSYFHGHKHGDENFYHKNGQPQSLIKYEYGKEVLEMIRWSEKGELLY